MTRFDDGRSYRVARNDIQLCAAEIRIDAHCLPAREKLAEEVEDLEVDDAAIPGIADDHAGAVYGDRQIIPVDGFANDRFGLRLGLLVSIVEGRHFLQPGLGQNAVAFAGDPQGADEIHLGE